MTIDWPTFIISVITVVCPSGVIVAYLTYKFNQQISESNQKNAQNNLKIQGVIDGNKIEFRHKLEIERFRNSQTFVKTSEVISHVYDKLLNLLDAADEYVIKLGVPDDEGQKIRAQALDAAGVDFYDYFRPNKIWIPKDTAKAVNDFSLFVITIVRKNNWIDNFTRQKVINHQQVEKYSTEVMKMQEQIRPLLTDIEDEFQMILGFPISKLK